MGSYPENYQSGFPNMPERLRPDPACHAYVGLKSPPKTKVLSPLPSIRGDPLGSRSGMKFRTKNKGQESALEEDNR